MHFCIVKTHREHEGFISSHWLVSWVGCIEKGEYLDSPPLTLEAAIARLAMAAAGSELGLGFR